MKYMILLEEKDFDALTSGKLVTKRITNLTVEGSTVIETVVAEISVLLSDIGYDLMLDMIGKKQMDLYKKYHEKKEKED